MISSADEAEDYPNVPRSIGVVASSGKATLHELDTVYGVEDMYDLMEIIMIDARNSHAAAKRQRD